MTDTVETPIEMIRRAQDLLYKKMDYVAARILFEQATAAIRAGVGGGSVIPSVVDLFFTTSSKDMNDAVNRRREEYLAGLLTADVGGDTRALGLQEKWRAVIQSLCPATVPMESVRVCHKGGRGANYDFLFQAVDELTGTVIWEQPAEFKFGARSVAALPQFLSLAEKALPFPVSYAEFYYTHYLPQYLALDDGLATVAIPDKLTYCKLVYGSNYEVHPFFQTAYEREDEAKEEKSAVVKASIEAWLSEFSGACSMEHLTGLFKEKQLGKVFLLWSPEGGGSFHVEKFGEEDLTLTEMVGVRNKNTLVVRSATRTFNLLLRWKNHKGILYPAWQIGLRSSH